MTYIFKTQPGPVAKNATPRPPAVYTFTLAEGHCILLHQLHVQF